MDLGYELTGALSSTGVMVNFLSLNDKIFISCQGNPSLGANL